MKFEKKKTHRAAEAAVIAVLADVEDGGGEGGCPILTTIENIYPPSLLLG